MKNANYKILVVEDEDSDFLLLERAFKRSNIPNAIHRVSDGMEAMHYLRGDGEYADRSRHPYPEVLIVDLKTPRMTGHELLAWIQEHQQQVIPTIILSSSALEADVLQAYARGAHTYFVKPGDFQSLVDLTRDMHEYWIKATTPRNPRG